MSEVHLEADASRIAYGGFIEYTALAQQPALGVIKYGRAWQKPSLRLRPLADASRHRLCSL
jgi:hypothetical protein